MGEIETDVIVTTDDGEKVHLRLGERNCSRCHSTPALPDMAFCSTCTRETLDWLRQTVHRAHHSGPLDECLKNTCDAALKALGKRNGKVMGVE